MQIIGNGPATKYLIYANASSSSFVSNRNVLHMATIGGTNNIGFWTTNRTNLSAWQAATGQDMNSNSSLALFVNEALGDITPLPITIDNIGTNVGVRRDLKGNMRSALTPDIGSMEFTGIHKYYLSTMPNLFDLVDVIVQLTH